MISTLLSVCLILDFIFISLSSCKNAGACERSTLHVECDSGVIVIDGALYRVEDDKCGPPPRENYSTQNVKKVVAHKCDYHPNCSFMVTDDELLGIANDNILKTKYLNVTYECIELSWEGAKSGCQSQSKELADYNFFKERNIACSGYWLQDRWGFTDFYAILGCFSVIDTDANYINYTFPSNNGIFQCQKVCNKTFIGLMGSTCFCTDTSASFSSSAQICSDICGHNKLDYCGNSKALSLYKKFSTDEIPQFENLLVPSFHGNCVHVEKDRNKYTWRYDECTEEVDGYICQKYSKNEYTYEAVEEENVNWSDARKKCISERDFKDLGYFNSGTDKRKIKGMKDRKQYWIGLYRNVDRLEKDDKKYFQPENLICGTWNSSILEHVNLADCKENNSFLCVKSKNSETTVRTVRVFNTTNDSTFSTLASNWTLSDEFTTVPATAESSEAKKTNPVVLGVVLPLACVVVISIVVCVVCIRYRNKKRRHESGTKRPITNISNQAYEGADDVLIISSKDKPSSEDSKTDATTLYDKAKPHITSPQENDAINGGRQGEMYDYTDTQPDQPPVKFALSDDDLEGLAYSYAGGPAAQTENSKLTKPKDFSYEMVDGNSEYVTTKEGEYDVTGQRRQKQQTLPADNIYDHAGENEYDVTSHVGGLSGDTIEYDLVKNVKNENSLSGEGVYDTTNC